MDPKVPEYWDKLRLVQIADIIMGQSPSSSLYSEFREGLPFLQGTADFGAKNPVPKVYCIQPTKVCKRDDILVSVRAPVGELNIADQAYCIGRGLSAIRGKPAKTWQIFLFYVLFQERKQLYRLMQGTTFDAVNRNDLQTILLLIPKLINEQKKIAAILQSIDNTIDKTKELVAKYGKMKQGLIADLFNPDNLRGIEQKLRDCCAFIRDGTHASFEDCPNGIPLLSAKDVKDGRIIRDNNPRRISLKDYHFIHAKYELMKGDVVLTIVGTIGRSAVIKEISEKFTFQRSVAIFRPKTEVNSYYLYYYFNTPQFQKKLDLAVNASAQGGVYLGALNNMFVIIPPDEKDQLRIVGILDAVNRKISSEQNYLYKLLLIRAGMMQDLLTGKVRVAA